MKVHLNTRVEGVGSITKDTLAQVRKVTSGNREASLRKNYEAIHQGLNPVNDTQYPLLPVYVPSIDEARSMAKMLSSRTVSRTTDTFETFRTVCQKDAIWFRQMDADDQRIEMEKACALFPCFLEALAIIGAFPKAIEEDSNKQPTQKKEEQTGQPPLIPSDGPRVQDHTEELPSLPVAKSLPSVSIPQASDPIMSHDIDGSHGPDIFGLIGEGLFSVGGPGSMLWNPTTFDMNQALLGIGDALGQ